MVQLMRSGNLRPDPETTPFRGKVPVKLETGDDHLVDDHCPPYKRSKVAPTALQQWNSEASQRVIPPLQNNPLDEPSPLGLSLRKSPSLLDLIQMRLSQGTTSSVGAEGKEYVTSYVKQETKTTAAVGVMEKLKASNFPASLLRIGQWKYKSRYEGDLVAKCYFAKHKLVWEVLDGGLKSKIEVQWSDIMALKANCPDDGPGSLTIVLGRPPLFYRETNPQPRKHTLWQATTDFTDGQASIHRQHFLQCPQGLLNRHYEKLIQCDMRLNFLSRQLEINMESPYFEPRSSVFDDREESKGLDFGQRELGQASSYSVSQNYPSPAAAHSSSLETETVDRGSIASEYISRDAPSPSSEVVTSRGLRNLDHTKVPGLHTSMSMIDIVNHIEQRLSEQMTSENTSLSAEGLECQGILEDIAQRLLSDTQFTTASDEKSLMSRVNSLCCLLQKDSGSAAAPSQIDKDEHVISSNNPPGSMLDNKPRRDFKVSDNDNKGDSSSIKQPSGMSRKDSFGELLLQLPRITSLPKFLFNISEEDC